MSRPPKHCLNDVLQALADGLSVKEIARKNSDSYDGTKNFLRRQRVRLGLKSNVQMVAQALRKLEID